jgi:hypothetical protein
MSYRSNGRRGTLLSSLVTKPGYLLLIARVLSQLRLEERLHEKLDHAKTLA